MSIRHRHTRSHTANRRSHHGLSAPRLSACANCGALHVRHTVCEHCGRYRDRVVIDVVREAEKASQKAADAENTKEENTAATGDTPVAEGEASDK